jgi:hypothetical protein
MGFGQGLHGHLLSEHCVFSKQLRIPRASHEFLSSDTRCTVQEWRKVKTRLQGGRIVVNTWRSMIIRVKSLRGHLIFKVEALVRAYPLLCQAHSLPAPHCFCAKKYKHCWVCACHSISVISSVKSAVYYLELIFSVCHENTLFNLYHRWCTFPSIETHWLCLFFCNRHALCWTFMHSPWDLALCCHLTAATFPKGRSPWPSPCCEFLEATGSSDYLCFMLLYYLLNPFSFPPLEIGFH